MTIISICVKPALRTLAACAVILSASMAAAGTVNVQLADPGNRAFSDAVIYAEPVGTRKVTAPPKPAVVDQVNKEFVPHVSVVQAGASVRFPNHDNIRHQVYSFSPAKTFELRLYHGMPSQPVIFDKPGYVVLGCNIHDRMVGYVLVVDTPYFAKADEHGRARLDGLPPGDYEIRAWQPLPTGAYAGAVQRIKINADGDAVASLKLDLKPEPIAAK